MTVAAYLRLVERLQASASKEARELQRAARARARLLAKEMVRS